VMHLSPLDPVSQSNLEILKIQDGEQPPFCK